MIFLIFVALFFGGAFFVNGIPHFVNGVSGRKFPTPFANPPGKGESSATVNVLWATLNFIIAYSLIFHFYAFETHSMVQMGVVGTGGLLMALILARTFGKVYGG